MLDFEVKYKVTVTYTDDKEDYVETGETTVEAESIDDAWDVVQEDWDDSMESDWVEDPDGMLWAKNIESITLDEDGDDAITEI
jgi:hypothetical protein